MAMDVAMQITRAWQHPTPGWSLKGRDWRFCVKPNITVATGGNTLSLTASTTVTLTSKTTPYAAHGFMTQKPQLLRKQRFYRKSQIGNSTPSKR
jgi:hypothetical protein